MYGDRTLNTVPSKVRFGLGKLLTSRTPWFFLAVGEGRKEGVANEWLPPLGHLTNNARVKERPDSAFGPARTSSPLHFNFACNSFAGPAGRQRYSLENLWADKGEHVPAQLHDGGEDERGAKRLEERGQD